MDNSSRDAVLLNLTSLLTGVIGTGGEADVAISPQLDAVVVFAGSELVLSCNLSEVVAEETFSPEPALSAGCSVKIASGAATSERP
ncbi:MAG: hypothetical protein M3454_04145 [Actinomycetota bacterium]|nr:hypothetical protein [Actinomycetota bacterium]